MQKNQKIWAIVPAAGVGARMGTTIPKQYLPLSGKTLIEVTITKLLQLSWLEGVVVALGEHDGYWQETEFASHERVIRVSGGKERSDSVFAALEYLQQNMNDTNSLWALVHDAARPCFSPEKVNELVRTCLSVNTGGILAASVADTVKKAMTNGESIEIQSTEDRSQLWLAHTPQFYPLNALISALTICTENEIPVTDEASAIEASGGKSLIVPDRRDNIKVTVPEDLPWAEHILKSK